MLRVSDGAAVMARRWINNQKVRNIGYVESHFCLDIRRLLTHKIIEKGKCTRWTATDEFPFDLVADLECPHQPFMRVEFPQGGHLIKCVYGTDALGRRRLFFANGNAPHAEKIYLVGDRLISRHGNLSYRQQSRTKRPHGGIPKQPSKTREELEREILTEERQLKAEEFQERESFGGTRMYLLLERRWLLREKRRSSLKRLQHSDAAMNQRVHLSPDEILQKYSGLAGDLKRRTERVTRNPWFFVKPDFAPYDPPEVSQRPHLDIQILARLKMLIPGQMIARQIGWPIKWLPQRRRQMHLIIDMRDTENPYAVVVFETVKKMRGQLFWIKKRKGLFGFDAYDFECPTTGRLFSTMLYDGGGFKLIEVRKPPDRKSPFQRLYDLRYQRLLSGDQDAPYSEEHIATVREAVETCRQIHGGDISPEAERNRLLKDIRKSMKNNPFAFEIPFIPLRR